MVPFLSSLPKLVSDLGMRLAICIGYVSTIILTTRFCESSCQFVCSKLLTIVPTTFTVVLSLTHSVVQVPELMHIDILLMEYYSFQYSE